MRFLEELGFGKKKRRNEKNFCKRMFEVLLKKKVNFSNCADGIFSTCADDFFSNCADDKNEKFVVKFGTALDHLGQFRTE